VSRRNRQNEPPPPLCGRISGNGGSFWSNIPGWIIKDTQGRSVEACLDIGCGFGTLGLYTKRLLNCDVYATDFITDYASPLALSKKNAFDFDLNNIELDNFPWKKNLMLSY
jgi:hypothetical protein